MRPDVSKALKVAISAVVIFVGIAGGMYVGQMLTGPKSVSKSWHESADSEGIDVQPYLELGDLFPPLPLAAPTDSTTDLRDLVRGERTVILIACAGCPKCDELLDYWSSRIEPKRAADLRVVIAQPNSRDSLFDAKSQLVNPSFVVTYDTRQVKDLFNIFLYPTLFAVDAQGFIEHIQLGFGDGLERGIYEFVTK